MRRTDKPAAAPAQRQTTSVHRCPSCGVAAQLRLDEVFPVVAVETENQAPAKGGRKRSRR